MKDLFNSLEFLHKIIYLKSHEQNIKNKEEREIIFDIYKKFEIQINKYSQNNRKAIRNFKLKSLYNSYKTDYEKAIENLEVYLKTINDDRIEYHLENNFREIKTNK